MPPPPPPPPPPPGMAGGPPPPPPPPNVGNTLPARPPTTKTTGALLTDITKGTRLKKTVTNDRSAPIIDKSKDGGSGSTPGAPSIPGLLRPENAAAATSRVRSNSDNSGGLASVAEAPQLGGLFAGGMPKLKKRSGGVDTGASRSSSFTAESSPLAPPPPSQVPTAPTSRPIPSLPGRRPTLPSADSAPARSSAPDLYKPSNLPPRAPPPLPGSRPPVPPNVSRKPSGIAPPVPSAPPPPPVGASHLTPSAPPPVPPPLPHSPAPSNSTPLASIKPPPIRSTPPPPPPAPPSLASQNGTGPSPLAKQAALNVIASGNSSPTSPAFAPPPPPPGLAPAVPFLPPSRPSSNTSAPSMLSNPSLPSIPQMQSRSSLDPSSYTLSNGPSRAGSNLSANRTPSYGAASGGMFHVEDGRWRFQDESQLPKPREFQAIQKRYRAGRGSSVPLDLSQFA